MTAILAAALHLAQAGLPALPLFPPTVGGPKERGKRPWQSRWERGVNSAAQVEAWFRQHHTSNLGLVCGQLSGLICVDIDPRNGGLTWYEANLSRLDGAITERTGSGGYHLWYRHPGGWIRSYRGVDGLAPGVELLADGGHQAVITPSVHYTGGVYSLPEGIPDFVTVRELADPLPAWIATAGPAPERRKQRDEPYTDLPTDVELCRQHLAALPPAVEGAGGDHATFVACCFGRDYNLSKAAFMPLLEAWNATCQPPWDPTDLAKKVRNAYSYAGREAGERSPAKQFSAVVVTTAAPTEQQLAEAAERDAWEADLARTDKGNVKAIDINVGLIARKHHQFVGLLHWNHFTRTVELSRAAPWDRRAEPNQEWTDHDTQGAVMLMQKAYGGAAFTPMHVASVVVYVAKLNPVHPLRRMLAATPWDGTPRLDGLLPMYFGAEDTPYTRAIGRCLLLSMVARVQRPGCKVDTMLILEGEQGKLKSSALRTLAGEAYFTDAAIDPGEKDAALAIRGKWLVELSEMHTQRRADVELMKAWLSRQVDRQRDPYARAMTDVQRQCVFVGSTNQAEYLRDETGNRRYWPVAVGVIDLKALERDRLQLWAEAQARYDGGEHWWLSGEQEALAKVEQEARFAADPWEDSITSWLETGRDFDDKAVEDVTCGEVLRQALGVMERDQTTTHKHRVGAVFRRLGWKRKTVRRGEKFPKGYVRPGRGP